jgi:hypothetical protein
MLRSEQLIFITRDGLPAGFFVPWDSPDLPNEVQKAVFQRLTGEIRQEREAQGTTEDVIQDDFVAWRRRR